MSQPNEPPPNAWKIEDYECLMIVKPPHPIPGIFLCHKPSDSVKIMIAERVIPQYLERIELLVQEGKYYPSDLSEPHVLLLVRSDILVTLKPEPEQEDTE